MSRREPVPAIADSQLGRIIDGMAIRNRPGWRRVTRPMSTVLVRRLAFVVVLAVGACTTPGPEPTDGPPLTEAGMRQALVDAFGPLWFCDPDVYPVQRQDELDAARERWPEVIADRDAFAVLTTAMGLDPDQELDEADQLAVYQAWKRLRAIPLDALIDGVARFDYLAVPAPGAAEGRRIVGTITDTGRIVVEQDGPAGEPMCPICLAEASAIDTPSGPIPVERLRIGDPVWSLDDAGRRIAATVIAVGSTVAPPTHVVIRLTLIDGRTVTASPGHPLADGRRIGDLRPGDRLDGGVVRTADRLPYDGRRTFDIAVSGPTGIYLVGGIPMGSTLDWPSTTLTR